MFAALVLSAAICGRVHTTCAPLLAARAFEAARSTYLACLGRAQLTAEAGPAPCGPAPIGPPLPVPESPECDRLIALCQQAGLW
jgi:hypothetical protein